jgi:hypothetical protein
MVPQAQEEVISQGHSWEVVVQGFEPRQPGPSAGPLCAQLAFGVDLGLSVCRHRIMEGDSVLE